MLHVPRQTIRQQVFGLLVKGQGAFNHTNQTIHLTASRGGKSEGGGEKEEEGESVKKEGKEDEGERVSD